MTVISVGALPAFSRSPQKGSIVRRLEPSLCPNYLEKSRTQFYVDVRQNPSHSIKFSYLRFIFNSKSSAVTKSVVSCGEKAQFETSELILILPRRSPDALNIQTPPGPVTNAFPFLSTFIPSGSPSPAFMSPEKSWKIRPFVSPPFLSNS